MEWHLIDLSWQLRCVDSRICSENNCLKVRTTIFIQGPMEGMRLITRWSKHTCCACCHSYGNALIFRVMLSLFPANVREYCSWIHMNVCLCFSRVNFHFPFHAHFHIFSVIVWILSVQGHMKYYSKQRLNCISNFHKCAGKKLIINVIREVKNASWCENNNKYQCYHYDLYFISAHALPNFCVYIEWIRKIISEYKKFYDGNASVCILFTNWNMCNKLALY